MSDASLKRVKRQSPIQHLWYAIYVGVGLVVLHVLSHLLASSAYKDSIKATVRLAAQIYQVRYDPASGEFRVFQGGSVWASLPQDQQVGPLGIGKSPAFRGLLTQRDRELSDKSREPRDQLRRFLLKFSELHGSRAREVGGSGGEWLVCVPQQQFAEAQSADLRAAIRRARDFIDSATTYKRGAARRDVPASDDPVVRAVIAHVNATLTKVGSLGLQPEPLPLEQRTALLNELPLAFLDDNAVLPMTRGATGEPVTERDKLTNEIVEIAQKEVFDCFWMFGCLRWFEIVFWVWFGVVTKMLYGYGQFAVGLRRKSVFEPNETQWAIARFVFAPLLALVFFWITSLTNLVEFGFDLSQPSMATLAFAFLMGMFPDDIYNVVSKAFHGLLKGSEKDERKDPAPRATELTANTQAASISLLADLRSRVQDVVTSVVRPVPPR